MHGIWLSWKAPGPRCRAFDHRTRSHAVPAPTSGPRETRPVTWRAPPAKGKGAVVGACAATDIASVTSSSASSSGPASSLHTDGATRPTRRAEQQGGRGHGFRRATGNAPCASVYGGGGVEMQGATDRSATISFRWAARLLRPPPAPARASVGYMGSRNTACGPAGAGSAGRVRASVEMLKVDIPRRAPAPSTSAARAHSEASEQVATEEERRSAAHGLPPRPAPIQRSASTLSAWRTQTRCRAGATLGAAWGVEV